MSVTEPIVVDEQIEGTAAKLLLEVPGDLVWFRGHFPDQPILPGVVQIKWALSFAERCLNLACAFAGMDTLKFQHVIRPNDRVSLTLEYLEDAHKLRFAFDSPHGRHSSGSIRLRAP